MLTRFVQAIAITSAVYLTMITYESVGTQPALVSSHHSTVRAERITYLLAEVLDFLRPSQRGAARHRASIPVD